MGQTIHGRLILFKKTGKLTTHLILLAKGIPGILPDHLTMSVQQYDLHGNVTMKVVLLDRHGQVIWQNPGYTFREQYQVSRELSSFFEEDQPAVDRLAHDFARTLVSNIVEAY